MAELALNEEQLQAITHGSGPLLIIAGAGTGKTTVITERIKHLILNDLAKPSEILALTFTEKAAREMEERVDIVMPYGYTQMWILTFHAFCDRILRNEALAIGLSPNFRMLLEAEAIQLIRNSLYNFELDYFRPLGNPTKFVGGFLQHFSRLQDEDVAPAEYLQYAKGIARRAKSEEEKEETAQSLELAKAYQKYTELKIKDGVMDFGDLIVNTLNLFRKHPVVLKRYQEQFKYILVDEFQDTNYAQNELALLLAGKQANITVVGDDDQSIYRFRGAAVSNVLQFHQRFPKARIITLTKNYRSTQEILDKSYQLIQFNNPDRLEMKEGIDKKLVSQRKVKGESIKFIWVDRVENEADKVAKEIVQLVGKEKRQYSDCAILVRANNHAEPFVRALSRLGIPYQFLGPGQLFRQEEIKDLIAYLQLLNDFSDSLSCYRVLSMEVFDIVARDIATLLNLARKKRISLFEACEQLGEIFTTNEVKQKIQAFVAMVYKHLGLMKKETAGQILYFFLEETGLLKSLLAAQGTKGERVAQNISKFFDKLKTYEVDHENASVAAVVDWINLSMEVGESPQATNTDWEGLNTVNILTIHSSKGLEFPVVFIVNLVTGRFPPYERREQIPIPASLIKESLPVGDYHLEEERRLFYVGMTRARDLLYVTAANYYGGGKRERKISPFVIEALGENYINQVRQEDTKPNSQLTFLDWAKSEADDKIKPLPLLINRLSYSQINDFRICPMHYKLKYIVGIPTPSSSAQSFGITMHKTMSDFYLGLLKGGKGKVDELMKVYEKNWIGEGYSSNNQEQMMKKKGKEFLERFYKTEFNPHTLPLHLEHPFSFRLKSLQIRGKIDRIDQTLKGIEIIDYKTGHNIPTEKEVAKDLQLTIYALAATEVKESPFGKSPEQIVLSLYYFEEGKRLTTTRTFSELERAKEETLKIVQEIASSEFTCSGSILCDNCEYKMFCSVVK